jgi:hypothetical protein
LVAISRWSRPPWRRAAKVAVAIAALLDFLVLFQLLVPVTPPSQLHSAGFDTKNEVFADSVGWDDVARQVAALYRGLPDGERTNTAIVSAYYGMPQALQLYGGGDLPTAVSPQLSSYYWLPLPTRVSSALMVDYEPSGVAWMCSSATLMGHLTVPYRVKGLEQGAPVTLCQLSEPLSQAWPKLRNFS